MTRLHHLDVGDLSLDALDPDRAQDVVERHPGVGEIGLVIAHADRVIGAAVDERDRNPVGADTEFVELARRAHRRPQPGKTGAQHDNARGAVAGLHRFGHASLRR